MNIQLASKQGPTAQKVARPQSGAETKKTATNSEPSESFVSSSGREPSWLDAGISLAGGATALVGGIAGEPLVVAGGALVNAVGTGMTAMRVSAQGQMDTAAWVSFVGGGTLTAAGLGALSLPAAPAPPNGPLPQLIKKYGFHGL